MSVLSISRSAVILLVLAAPPAAAQAMAHGEPPHIRSAAPPLADHYRVRLTSAWPRLPSIEGCGNGGHEVLEGALGRTAEGNFAGTLTRRTQLLFCGVHGGTEASCALELDGSGAVEMHGVVVSDPRSPSGRALRATWTPRLDHAARVSGACDAEFKRKVERMYLTVRHGVEFALPNAGAAPVTERLEDYAWVVEVE